MAMHIEASSDESDDGGDSLFLAGRPKKVQRAPTETQSSLETPTSEVVRSLSSPSHKAVKRIMTPGTSLDEDSRRDSLTVNPRIEAETGGSLQGSPRRRSYQGSRASSRDSPLPAEFGDFVVVSKGDSKRVSGALDDWTLISQSEDEGSGTEEGPQEDNEDLERKKLYLLVARCIAYPFNAKFQIETTPPRAKLNPDRFRQICRTLRAMVEAAGAGGGKVTWADGKLSKSEQEVVQNRGFVSCVELMLDVVLVRPEVVEICHNGGFSVKELESIFKVKASIFLGCGKGGLSPEEEVTQWCNTFRKIVEQCSQAFEERGSYSSYKRSASGAAPAATMLSPDKLYKVFQEILKIRSIEHQVLYRECQLGSPEEQEAVVRRELQARKKALQNTSLPLMDGKFGSHRVEDIYREEQLKMLKLLNNNLDQLSLQGSSVGTQEKKKKRVYVSESGNPPIAKQDLHFDFKVKVTIHEITELQSAHEGKPLFVVFNAVDSGRDPYQTQPGESEYSAISFGEVGEFWLNTPMPQVKLELRSLSKSLLRDSKLLAKHTHTALPSSSDVYTNINLHLSDKKDKDSVLAKLRISTLVERPTSIKKCGYLVAIGNSLFKQRKKRFFALIQLSQYKFLFCSYQPNATQPKETLLLDQGLTVEYASDHGELSQEPDVKCVFDLVFEDSETGRIHFGCRDDADRESWIEWMVRGTGQSHQPQQMGVTEVKKSGSTDLERYGLKEAVAGINNTSSLDPHKLFIKLFQACLEFRLNEDMFSRGLFSPAQMYVLDEFCARYGVRDPFRHLTCIQDWLDCMERGVSIWPVMMQSSFCFCQMHIGGMNPPEKSSIVTAEEREVFVEVCQRIEDVVTYQLLNFRTCFPFCCPKGDLRTTLKLFDLVTSINHPTRTSTGIKAQKLLTHIMEKGALINYKQVYSSILDNDEEDAPLSIAKTFVLADLCIKFMYELHDFFWEEFNPSKVFTAHINAFWSFFLVDMREAMSHSQDTILKLQLFHTVNNYFSSQSTMRLEDFHQEFLNDFTPVVVLYIDTLEESLKQELATSLAEETWLPLSDKCCVAVDGAMKSLLSFKRFLQELNWPEESFAAFLDQKVAAIAADRFQEAAEVIQVQLEKLMSSGKGSTPLDYTLPPQFFTMMNSLVYLSSQVLQICASQRVQIQSELQNESTLEHRSSLNIEEHLSSILDDSITMAISKLCNPLQEILIKLAKFDPSEGFFASLKMLIPTNIPVSAFTEFLTSNLALVSTNLITTIFNNFVVNWYECQMQLLNQWLEKRQEFSLHKTQLTSAEELFKTLYVSFVACEVPPRQLRSQSHDQVEDRIRMENSHLDLLSIGKD